MHTLGVARKRVAANKTCLDSIRKTISKVFVLMTSKLLVVNTTVQCCRKDLNICQSVSLDIFADSFPTIWQFRIQYVWEDIRAGCLGKPNSWYAFR